MLYTALDNIAGAGRWEVLLDGTMVLPEGITESMVREEERKLKEEEYATKIQRAVQSHLDKLAQSYRYDNMASVRGYTGFPNKFQRECMSMSIWAGDCWAKVEELEQKMKAGTISMPTIEEVIQVLPVYEGGS